LEKYIFFKTNFYDLLMTKCIQRIRDLFEYALYKFTLYLLTLLYLPCRQLLIYLDMYIECCSNICL